ncbi:hypothetical protein ALC53_07119 [Atta colombica]|uniref:Uncharacterized protein n=1 Tax=Atta colombica TaxID=520822 RepID=A0A195BCN9_9HYME|nr:hypothetical protein ALC53_07119 [Atta colombica]
MVRFQDRPIPFQILPPILADRRLATVQRSYVTIPRRVHGDTSYTIRPEHQLPSRKSSAHRQRSTGSLISLATLFNVHERRKEFTIKLRYHPGFRAGIEPRMSRNHPNGQCKQGKFKRTKPREIIRRMKVQGSKRRVHKPQLVKSYEVSVTRSPMTTVHEKKRKKKKKQIGSAQEEWKKSTMFAKLVTMSNLQLFLLGRQQPSD